MEYFEEDKKAQKKKRKNYDYSQKNIFYLIILSSLLCFLFFIFSDNFFPKELKEIKNKENKNKDLYQPLINPSLDSNPHELTEFLLNLFDNYNKIDFTNFEKNLKIIVQKIYNIINNEKENEDAYILLSSIYGAFLADSMGSFCEFKQYNKNNHLKIFNSNNGHIFKPGQVTDDSEMAMSQAYAIMDNQNIYELNENLI